MRHAVIAGASGLVGSHLLAVLARLKQRPTITILGRKPMENLPPGVQQAIGDLHDENFLAKEITSESWVFCCIGTTMAQAGSEEAFKEVDYGIPVALGRVAKQKGCPGMSVVSSMGASPNGFFFYSRVKGEMEQALQAMNLPALHIFRPGLLVGKRKNVRLGEKVGQVLSYVLAPFFIGPFEGYGSIRGEVVARGMVRAAMRAYNGVRIYKNPSIRREARQLKAII